MSVGQGNSTDAQSATVAALSGGQQQAPAQNNGDGQGGDAQQSQGVQGLAEGFLGRVNPAHRAIVEPYVKQWDAGVTRRFQELHGQLQPYQQLGDPDTLGQAMQLFKMIDEQPEQVLSLLQEALGQGGQEQQPVPAEQQGLQEQQEQGGQGQAPGLSPEVTQQLNTLQNVVEALAQRILDQDSSTQESQEDQQLDQYFDLLKKEFGDFDEDYVIAKMLAGVDGEQAVQQFQQSIQGQVNQRAQRPNLPPILSGGGSVPQEGQSISKAPRSEVKNLVANILAQSGQG